MWAGEIRDRFGQQALILSTHAPQVPALLGTETPDTYLFTAKVWRFGAEAGFWASFENTNAHQTPIQPPCPTMVGARRNARRRDGEE